MPLGEQLKEFCSRCLGKRKTDELPEKPQTYIGKLQHSLHTFRSFLCLAPTRLILLAISNILAVTRLALPMPYKSKPCLQLTSLKEHSAPENPEPDSPHRGRQTVSPPWHWPPNCCFNY